MKCQRCSAEVPGGAQFCMKCGSPTMAAQSAGGITMARSLALPDEKKSKAPLIAGIAAALLLLALALFFGYRALTDRSAKVPQGTRVVDAPGVTPSGSGLVDKNARVQPPSRLTDVPGRVQAAQPQPVDVIDYLAWLAQMERRRRTADKAQLSGALGMSAGVTGDPLKVLMNPDGNWEGGLGKVMKGLRDTISKQVTEYQMLSAEVFRKVPPAACSELHHKYYDVFARITASLQHVQTQLGTVGEDPQKALDAVTAIGGSGYGSASEDIDQSARRADDAYADVCKKYNITKDFVISTESGGFSPFSR